MDRRKGRLTSPPDRQNSIRLVRNAINSGANKEKACEIVGIDSRTFDRWNEKSEDLRPIVTRPTPKNKLTNEEEQEIIRVINLPEYCDLPPSQIIPKLADKGKYIASESSFYRVMKKHNQQKHRGSAKVPVKRKITTHCATNINQVWTWDITWLKTSVRGLYYKLYLMMDIWDRSIVAHEVWEEENSENASILIEKAVIANKVLRKPLVLHSDNGSPMKGSTFLATLERLGITKSFSRPRVSNDNPYSESLFKTMKYCPEFPKKGFSSLEDAREWVLKFVNWYNNEHLHSGLNFISPMDRRLNKDIEMLKNRQKVYEQARNLKPERWTRQTRKWNYIDKVYLNPEREIKNTKNSNSTSVYAAKAS